MRTPTKGDVIIAVIDDDESVEVGLVMEDRVHGRHLFKPYHEAFPYDFKRVKKWCLLSEFHAWLNSQSDEISWVKGAGNVLPGTSARKRQNTREDHTHK